MELIKLRYFVEVCRYGNMTKAANSLFVSQQNVSKAIASLEEELGAELFLRGGNALRLTPDGEYLLQKAGWILAEARVVESHFQARSARGAVIRLAGATGVLARCGKKTQRLVLQQSDRFNIAFMQLPAQRVEEEIRADAVRFGLALYDPDMDGQFDIVPLGGLKPVFIAASRHPLVGHSKVTFHQLAQYPMAAPGVRTTGGKQIAELFRAHGTRPHIVLPSSSASEIAELVRNSDSLVGGTTDRDYELIRSRGLTKLVTEEAEDMRIVLISRRDEPLSRTEREFRDALVETFR